MNAYEAALILFANATAAYWAALVAAIVSPLYVFILAPYFGLSSPRAAAAEVASRCCYGTCAIVRGFRLPAVGDGKRWWPARSQRRGAPVEGAAPRTTKGKRTGVERLIEEARAMRKAQNGGVSEDEDDEAIDLVMPQYRNRSPIRPSGGGARASQERAASAPRESGLFSTPNSSTSVPSARGSVGRHSLAAPDDNDDSEAFGEIQSPSKQAESDLAIYGQPVKRGMTGRGSGRGSTQPLPSTGDATLDAAIESGEVYYQPTNRLPSIEDRIRHLITRHQRHRLYHERNITRDALGQLFHSPAFHSWYTENHEGLMREVSVRHNGLKLRSFASVFTLWLGVCALPAFSFSNKAWANLPFFGGKSVAGACGFHALPTDAPTSQATLLQLLVLRAEWLVESRSVPAALSAFTSLIPAKILTAVFWCVNRVEVLCIVAAVCALMTSAFMPRRRLFTGVLALVGLLVVRAEASLATEQSRVDTGMFGLGTFVTMGVVAVSIVKGLRSH